MRLGRQHGRERLAGARVDGRFHGDPLQLFGQGHSAPKNKGRHYDEPMLETAAATAFAVAAVIAAATLALVVVGRGRPQLLAMLAGLFGACAAAAWAGVALEPTRDLAISAGGLTVAALVEVAGSFLARSLARLRREDEAIERARLRLHSFLDQEVAERGDELTRTLARLRADSISLLQEQERRLADERRQSLVEREQERADEVAGRLADAERRVDERLRGWSDDLDRAQRGLAEQLGGVEQRQRQLIAEAEARIEAEATELSESSELQRASVLRLREELERSAQTAVAETLDELQSHTTERRRVIEEMSERLRKREQALGEQIERAEGDATKRIESAFADVERRQVEHLERVLNRESQRFAEAAGTQFEVSIKAAREEAASRFARELDRAATSYARQADALFAERLTNASDSGVQRLERRLAQAQTTFERQRDELTASLGERLAEAESEVRRIVDSTVAVAEAERRTIEARIVELARRLDESGASRQP